MLRWLVMFLEIVFGKQELARVKVKAQPYGNYGCCANAGRMKKKKKK